MADQTVDVIVIGSGIAGLMTAHLLADQLNVIVITKSGVEVSNSSWAQGGMAAALGTEDNWQKHFADTINAGQDHHNYSHTEILVKKAPEIVKTLIDLGVPFDRMQDGNLSLGMEGAHQQRRIVHANGDKTGEAFTKALIKAVRDRVTILDHTEVHQLVKSNNRIVGVEIHNKQTVYARTTVLATGGLGQLYTHTSNVPEATGDGFALAYRAGAVLRDMEFIQFHPTLLTNEQMTFGLISEAVRGEGATLVDESGLRIMAEHPLKELASRDVVSREIHRALEAGRKVYLDCSGITNFQSKFPGLSARCKQLGINVKDKPLSVAPGAHFISGGVQTDQFGRTNLEGLYAVGEVACTGVHGANRLASNSLLEGLVFAEQVAKDILANKAKLLVPVLVKEKREKEELLLQLPSKDEIKRQMTRFVGIERSLDGLNQMKKWLEPFVNTAKYVRSSDTKVEIESKNMVLVAWLITNAALMRTESRGGHYRADFPERNDSRWFHHYLSLTMDTGISVQVEKDHKIAMNSL
ncbi:L-aspartate oxidase [Halalkalibacter akibai]|uniref:L-aspartate oxidase n=1 Tax=Halalkalibacter akibai (strain ATCC 43226 / DSM 21942 / CIP 109018 / JCM 9157 / 1139) TaxID=1236973 RepID=W4QT85_HALA3|nr:L-aspartate oxidase [Halalkalibacter akibai]GAE35112.1 L-aspartate oxidase [Halalkalibacter akibai JCM 9157]